MPESFVEVDETQKFLLPGNLARPQCNFPPFRPLPKGWNVGSLKPAVQLWFQGAIGDLCKVSLAGIRNLPGEHCQLLILHSPLAYASRSSCKLISALNFRHTYLLLLAVQLGKKKPDCCYRDHQMEWHQNIFCTTPTECSRVSQHPAGGHCATGTPLLLEPPLSCPALCDSRDDSSPGSPTRWIYAGLPQPEASPRLSLNRLVGWTCPKGWAGKCRAAAPSWCLL